MRYIREINGKLEEYKGLGVSHRFLIEQGYIKTNLSDELNSLKIKNNKIVKKTQKEVLTNLEKNEKIEYNNYYKQNPKLVNYIKQFKKILEILNLDYTKINITPLIIINAINTSNLITDKTTFINNALEIWESGILLNIKILNIKNPETFIFNNIHKLIKYLPE